MRLVCGVGMNDSLTAVHSRKNKSICPYYQRWKDMLKRCYSPKLQEKYPTYKGCTVCDDWLLFSSFRSWMKNQDWKGRYLDKDLLIQGNKIYSPLACVFVDRAINNLLNNHKSKKGRYPQGVHLHSCGNRFCASISKYGEKISIGLFLSVADAKNAYDKEKYNYIKAVASTESEPLKSALLNYKIEDQS